VAIFRRRSRNQPVDPITATVDPSAVPDRYRAVVADALRARTQFAGLVSSTQPGPLHDRMTSLAGDVDAGVLAVWQVVQHATRIEDVVATLDPGRVTDELKQARRAGADPATVEALAERFASNQRLLNSLEESRQRLPVLEARLGTAVARAAELVLTSSLGAAPELDRVHDDLTRLTQELDALRLATHELP
jgi:hypothetical protein